MKRRPGDEGKNVISLFPLTNHFLMLHLELIKLLAVLDKKLVCLIPIHIKAETVCV